MKNLKLNTILLIHFCIIMCLFISIYPQPVSALETNNKYWNITSEISSGYVSEYISSPNNYKGAGFSLKFVSNGFQLISLNTFEEYNITYYGATKEGLINLINNRNNATLLKSQPILEKKEDYLFWFGKNLHNKNFLLLFGYRHINFSNSFSSMKHVGPAIGINFNFDISDYSVKISINGSTNQNGISTDHNNDFLPFDGEKSISYFGEPKYLTEVSTFFLVSEKSWLKINIGYTWSLFRFKYINRFKNGLILQVEI